MKHLKPVIETYIVMSLERGLKGPANAQSVSHMPVYYVCLMTV